MGQSDIREQCMDLLEGMDTDGQLRMLKSIIQMVRNKKNSKYQTSYSRERYAHDDEFRQKHLVMTSNYITNRYAKDPAWRAKVREQQREYYQRRNQAKEH